MRYGVMNKQKIVVVGMGYVGTALADAFDRAGHLVRGYDTDALKARHGDKGYPVDTDATKIALADAVILCVPTGLREDNLTPDLLPVCSAARAVATHMKEDTLVVVESTLGPGMTERHIKPLLDESGKRYHLAYSPERIDPGNKEWTLKNTPKLVSADDREGLRRAMDLYHSVCDEPIPIPSIRVAEAAKCLENTYRLVNISLVNDLKLGFQVMGIDLRDVIDAASTKPFGFQAFYPGPGAGGHCIPVDPLYLQDTLYGVSQPSCLIDYARMVNNTQPMNVVWTVREHFKWDVKGKKILVVGVGYKRDSEDTRHSPGIEVIRQLAEHQAIVYYHDPLVPRLEVRGLCPASQVMTPIAYTVLDCVILMTDHTDIDYKRMATHAAVIVDTRGKFGKGDGVRGTLIRA